MGTKNIHISLVNWNDELPKFDNTTLSEVSIKEDVVIGTYIATVHATDRDVDDNVTSVKNYAVHKYKSFRFFLTIIKYDMKFCIADTLWNLSNR